MAETLAQHSPASKQQSSIYTSPLATHITSERAVKVGGRRLSISSRSKPAAPTADTRKTSPPAADTAPDYPRPAAPGEQQELHQQQQEEDVPKKKQGTGGDEHERRIQESLYRKAEQNRPKKEFLNGPKTTQRVNQPAGKSFGI
ncbi:hypothetical protein DICSQDRAFT_123749 [Dichomitus squalens LYAD-421 SS1]|uniref:uncharacterized protein n=1 Tax=Dichomitus squalens (strain LYAD-421) TaxID=732165 RepID=UPI0004411E2B|nr:uncharacterized protein DICSQDRAFT_123749 [Dichomitus squalens LYAD-421 SS1]EJF67389.1 hypothetical protein DICSQDRAFT_123749 [Dichomitus squalens LYAD-421 SS1]